MSDPVGDLGKVDAEVVLVYQSCFSELVGYLTRMVSERGVAEELAQEAGLRLMQASVSHVIDNPRAYLYFVAANLARDHLRHQQVVLASTDPVSAWMDRETPALDRVLNARQELKLIREALEQLPQKARQVFELVRIEGMSYKEVAEVMQITPKTVENHIGRAIARLSELLGDWQRPGTKH